MGTPEIQKHIYKAIETAKEERTYLEEKVRSTQMLSCASDLIIYATRELDAYIDGLKRAQHIVFVYG